MEEISTLLKKYDKFKYAQLRSIQQLSASHKIVTIAIQDDDGEDTNIVHLEFKNITESKILVNSVLSFLDMGDGIILIKENDLYGFALGCGSAMLQVHNAPLYIVAKEMYIEEK
ncbi:hypothetical protein JHD48_01400 [Sulfurimonas sp. SAG-AH-194-I05]|nr:hypothetical protein [Sulfurimonas sp. SAG-AH-194-I05]MDF1874385.1 hypothetical protein [Sulfurimonas sp. SAG-AH-194-I05]